MPVRSLSSSVLRWPDRQAVDRAVREWAAGLIQERPDVVAIGYFGSYARGDWGVGSDIDLVVVLADSGLPFERRAVGLDTRLTTALPVPADLLVYTSDEWQRLAKQPTGRRLGQEVIWVRGAGGHPG
jgi:predicted nucleotidyltransferase